MSAGTVFGDRYRLISQLGKGGMATVWRAEHLTLGSTAAVKLMHDGTAQDPDARARFVREARAAAALRSPHVVQIFDYGLEGETPYIAMELLEGETLAQRLRREKPLSYRDTSWILTHVSRALTRAHEAGVIHRDLKPANIFLVAGETPLAKVLDFGIAKTVGSALVAGTNPLTQAGTLLGTPHYMSPEQVESHHNVDHSTDIWALGIIACECITGRVPFEATTLPQLIRAICDRPIPLPSHLGPVPPGFDAWFARAAARNPKQRFASAKQALAELGPILARDSVPLGSPESHPSAFAPTLSDKSIEQAAPTTVTLITKWRRSRWARPALLVGALASGGLVLSTLYYAVDSRQMHRPPWQDSGSPGPLPMESLGSRNLPATTVPTASAVSSATTIASSIREQSPASKPAASAARLPESRLPRARSSAAASVRSPSSLPTRAPSRHTQTPAAPEDEIGL
jgi:serine/threonine-protein kinase